LEGVEDLHPTSPEISVDGAKEAFNELERKLSRASTLQKSSDPEKGDEDEVFDLRDYLTTVNAAQDQAGIISHHKRVAVTWQNLEVIVPGGGDFKVF
jgi:glycine cleavage system protein P-like pyridoxal-binding family